MEMPGSQSGLPPAIYLTHTYYEDIFLYGAWLASFIVAISVFLLIYVTIENYRTWQSGRGIALELFQRIWGLAQTLGGLFLLALYLIFLSRTWSVTIGIQGIRLISPLDIRDPGGVVAWSNIEEAKIIMRGKNGGVPYVYLKGQGSQLTFPIWEMSHEDAQLTCEMIFSKLKNSQLTQSRETIKQACTYFREGWLPGGVRLTRLSLPAKE